MYFKPTVVAALALLSGIAYAGPAPGTHKGDATVFSPSIGACGVKNTDADKVAGVSQAIFDAFGNQTNPNDNPVCGRVISVTANGKSVKAKVEDKCGGCSKDSILLSTAAFSQLADPNVGTIHGVSWVFV